MLCGEILQGCKCFVVKYYKTVDLPLSLPLWPWGWRSWWRSQLFLLLPVTSLSRDRTLLPCQLLASTPHICPVKKQSDIALLRWSKVLEEGIRQTSVYVDKTRPSPPTQWEQTENNGVQTPTFRHIPRLANAGLLPQDFPGYSARKYQRTSKNTPQHRNN